MDRPVVLIAVLTALSLLPIVLVMLTSFVKISVVLFLLRNALGLPNIPPTMVVTGLALLLTFVAMAPVGHQVYQAAEPDFRSALAEKVPPRKMAEALIAGASKASEPLREFLARHADHKERALFAELRGLEEAGSADSFLVLAPAFVISELKDAFAIGFLLFLPMLIIDLVVGTTLLSLGMHMLSPSMVSLPFKLLLFVLVDGWMLLTQGLVMGYLG